MKFKGRAPQGAADETLGTSDGGGSLLWWSSSSRRRWRALKLRGQLFNNARRSWGEITGFWAPKGTASLDLVNLSYCDGMQGEGRIRRGGVKEF